MELHRDVIMDLLPVYLAGEASAETRRLIESQLARDAELARLAEAGRQELAGLKPPVIDRKEPQIMELESVKRLALIRTLVLSCLFSGVFLAILSLALLAVRMLRS